MTTYTATEMQRMARVLNVEFVDGAHGRVPRVAGSGVDVLEVVMTYRAAQGNLALVQEAYDWLSAEQIAAALAYWRAYPEEIDHRIAQEEACFNDL